MIDRYQTLIPRPVRARQLPGTFELAEHTALIAAPGAEAAAEAVRLLLAPLRLPLRPASAGPDQTGPDQTGPDGTGPGVTVRLDPAIAEPEGYRLRVGEAGIELYLHLTDDQGWRVESRRYPRLAEFASHRDSTSTQDGESDGIPYGGYYTLDDLAEVAAYAAERGVTVVPEIDLPGHAAALLAAYPQLGTGTHTVRTSWGISNGVVKPLPATVQFVAELLDELTGAVPGPYVHLGGDECPLQGWLDDPEVAAYQRSLGMSGPVDLFGHFLRELGGVLAAGGRRMVVWDEGFVGGGLLPDSIVTAWRGDRVARRAAAAEYAVVRCPVFPAYFDYDQSDRPDEPLAIGGPITLADVAAFAPVPPDWDAAQRERVIGVQFNAWTEYIADAAHLDYMVFPRACAMAEVGWTGRPAADLPSRLLAHLPRLAAAGCRYRPLDGPAPWQAGGTGARRHRPRTPIAKVRARLEALSERADVPPGHLS